MFKVGDNVVLPMHGAGTIESIEDKNILDKQEKYYVMNMPGEVKVMIPAVKAESIGVRNIIDNEETLKVFKVLETDTSEMSDNWNKRYRDNMEKMKTGDIYEVADVVRNLSFKQKEKGLSTGEKKMLTNAKQILISELALSSSSDIDTIESQVNAKLDTSYKMFGVATGTDTTEQV